MRYAGAIYNQAQAIGEAAGLNSVAFAPYGNPTEIMSPNQGGVAVISRWPIRATRNRRLPTAHDTPPDARVALLVTLQLPTGTLDVVNTHLSWQPVEGPLRLTQLGMVIDEFSSNEWTSPAARALLVGDLNATDQEPAIHLANERLKDAFRAVCHDEPGYTWVCSNPMNANWRNMPDRRLDYIFSTMSKWIARNWFSTAPTDASMLPITMDYWLIWSGQPPSPKKRERTSSSVAFRSKAMKRAT